MKFLSECMGILIMCHVLGLYTMANQTQQNGVSREETDNNIVYQWTEDPGPWLDDGYRITTSVFYHKKENTYVQQDLIYKHGRLVKKCEPPIEGADAQKTFMNFKEMFESTPDDKK